MQVLSVQGTSDGISGQVSVSGAYGTVSYNNCSISYGGQGVPSYGGLSNVVPLETPANGVFSFNCYFAGPHESGTYSATIIAEFFPPFVTCTNNPWVGCANDAEVTTIGVLAGAGPGVPLQTTVSTQSSPSIAEIQTTPTSTLLSSSTSSFQTASAIGQTLTTFTSYVTSTQTQTTLQTAIVTTAGGYLGGAFAGSPRVVGEPVGEFAESVSVEIDYQVTANVDIGSTTVMVLGPPPQRIPNFPQDVCVSTSYCPSVYSKTCPDVSPVSVCSDQAKLSLGITAIRSLTSIMQYPKLANLQLSTPSRLLASAFQICQLRLQSFLPQNRW